MDSIQTLPTDPNKHATPKELQILDAIFQDEQMQTKIGNNFKMAFYSTLVFILFSLPIIDPILSKFIPNSIVKLGAKTVLFFIIIFILSKTC